MLPSIFGISRSVFRNSVSVSAPKFAGRDLNDVVQTHFEPRRLRVEDDEFAPIRPREVVEKTHGLVGILHGVVQKVRGKKPVLGELAGEVVADSLERRVLSREARDELRPGRRLKVVLQDSEIGLGGFQDVHAEEIASRNLEVFDLEVLEVVGERIGHRVRGHENGRRFALGRAEGKLAQKLDLVLRVAGGEKPKRSLGLFRNLFGAREERGIGVELADGELVEKVQEVGGRTEVSVQMMHCMRAAQGPKSVELCAHEGEDRLLFVPEEDADA